LRKERENVKKDKMPEPINLNDCVLLYQMGYATIVNDGKVVAVVKESKKKNGLKAALTPTPLYH
jgi:hypothetical protein